MVEGELFAGRRCRTSGFAANVQEREWATAHMVKRWKLLHEILKTLALTDTYQEFTVEEF